MRRHHESESGAAEGPRTGPVQAALIDMLWDLEAIRVSIDEPFTLASGNRSPLYVNCRQVISSPDFMRLFTAAARRALAGCEFDAVAGGATAGIPYAAYLACDLNRPLLYVRKSAKGYGTDSQVEGAVTAGWRVLLVEDLITDGGSKLPFLEALEAVDMRVTDVLVLVDREQGGGELLAEGGVTLRALVSRSQALAAGIDAGRLEPAARAEVETYFDDPAGWHQKCGFDYEETN